MYINPIFSYYSVLNTTDGIKDYKTIYNTFTSFPEKKEDLKFAINTKREVSDISEYISNTTLEKSNEKTKSIQEKHKNIRNAPIIDRVDETIEDFKEGNVLSGFSKLTLGILYGPEDFREVKSAYQQIKSFLENKKFVEEYDYSKAQHPYSFFRGSVLHDKMNPFNKIKTGYSEFDEKIEKAKFWLLDKDKAIIDTKIGKNFLIKNNIVIEKIKTPIDEIGSTKDFPIKTKAYKFISKNKLANLTARVLTRTSVIGTFVDAGIDGIKAYEEIKKGEEAISTIVESAFNFISSTISTAFLGAIGSKKGPLGSLCAITLANCINEKVEDFID